MGSAVVGTRPLNHPQTFQQFRGSTTPRVARCGLCPNYIPFLLFRNPRGPSPGRGKEGPRGGIPWMLAWKCNFWRATHNTTGTEATPAPRSHWFRLFVFYFEKKWGLGVLMALTKNCVKLRKGMSGIFAPYRNCMIEITVP